MISKERRRDSVGKSDSCSRYKLATRLWVKGVLKKVMTTEISVKDDIRIELIDGKKETKAKRVSKEPGSISWTNRLVWDGR